VELAHGTIDGAAVYPREVAKVALSKNAAALIFGHVQVRY
jgi:DNA repair protein RadC